MKDSSVKNEPGNMLEEKLWRAKTGAFLYALGCEDLFPELAEEENAAKINELCFRTAAAADRFPFPGAGVLPAVPESPSLFLHPLCGESLKCEDMPSRKEIKLLFRPFLEEINSSRSWKERFYQCWAHLPRQKVLQNGRSLQNYPADSYMPDHTLWDHAGLTSALRSCVDHHGEVSPVFLLFQMGGAQEYIAQARTTRDLRGGSYILSWLMAHALAAIAETLGPDNVIFPNLRRQPLTEFLCHNSFGESSFESLHLDSLLVPTLPNRFFALLPESRGEELAKKAEEALHGQLQKMGSRVKDLLARQYGHHLSEVEKERWNAQIKHFPQITWQIMPWEKDPHKALELFDRIAFDQKHMPSPSKNLRSLCDMACSLLPEEDRNPCHYRNHEKTELENPGFAWAAHYGITEFALAARRKTRDFDFFKTDEHQRGSRKDELSGVAEVIGSPREEEGDISGFGELGAMNLIKRHFFRAVLQEEIGDRDNRAWSEFFEKDRFVSTPEMASRGENPEYAYFAVLAMDGDQMGTWVSGQKAPLFSQVIAPEIRGYFEKHLSSEQWKSLQRPLSSAWHLQFSQALGNFSLLLAGKIVEYFHGQLIYAGGDDVLAMLPSSKALECARALRGAFRGMAEEMPSEMCQSLEIHQHGPGILSIGQGEPFLVPGPGADVSCGIAVAHKKYPLQKTVQEAGVAEKRAKNRYGRGAVALSLLKHSGEILHWGARWETTASGAREEDGTPRKASAALALFRYYSKLAEEERVSGRFPYALAQLLAPYRLDYRESNFQNPLSESSPEGRTEEEASREMQNVLWKEFQHVLERQRTEKGRRITPRGNSLEEEASALLDEDRYTLLRLGARYLQELSGAGLADFANLFLASAFVFRDISPKGGNKS